MRFSLLILVVLLFQCSPEETEQNSSTFTDPFTEMDYGPFEVGYQTDFLIDKSRPHVDLANWDGKLFKGEVLPGRALAVHLWYPATGGQQITYGNYVDLMLAQSETDPNASLGKEFYLKQALALGGDSTITMEKLEPIWDLPVNASLGAEPVQGYYPLIIFPNGGTPAYNSIMCEYMASHGYIVAGVSLNGPESTVIDANVRGLEVAVDDMEFVLQHLLEMESVNPDKIGLLANAIESSFSAALVSRNEKIKALVSLEGGFLSRFEQEILNQTVFYQPEKLDIPILSIYSPHPSISPRYIDHLHYSDRYYARYPQMSEFHFINFGMLEEIVPGIIGPVEGDPEKGFISGSQLILAFFDAKLKNESNDLRDAYMGGKHPEETDSVYYYPGKPAPPSITQLKAVFIEEGMEGIDSIYQYHKGIGDETPFSPDFYADFKNWLAWKKDPEYKSRLKLYELAVDSYPGNSLHNYLLGAYLERNGESGRPYFLKSRELLDSDASLDVALREELRAALQDRL